MHARNRLIMLALILGLCVGSVAADGETDAPAADSETSQEAEASETEEESQPPVISSSVMVGGMVTYDTSYIVASGMYSKDRLSLYGEGMVDFGFPTWADGSSGSYYQVSGGGGMRVTAIHGGQGVLFGMGFGAGFSSLTVNDAGTKTTVTGWQFAATPHFGIRAGRPSGIFGEAIIKLLIPLNDVFAYVGDTPPDTDAARFSVFRYQAVYIPRAAPIARFYIGMGYTFGN